MGMKNLVKKLLLEEVVEGAVVEAAVRPVELLDVSTVPGLIAVDENES